MQVAFMMMPLSVTVAMPSTAMSPPQQRLSPPRTSATPCHLDEVPTSWIHMLEEMDPSPTSDAASLRALLQGLWSPRRLQTDDLASPERGGVVPTAPTTLGISAAHIDGTHPVGRTPSAASTGVELCQPAPNKACTRPSNDWSQPHGRPQGKFPFSSNGLCEHKESWRRIRSKHGTQYFQCLNCGQQWCTRRSSKQNGVKEGASLP